MQFVIIFKIITLLSAAGSTVLAVYAYTKRKKSRPLRYYSALMFANTVYATGYLLEINMPDLASVIMCLNFEYIGLSSIPVLWIFLACSYNPRNMEKDRKTNKGLNYLWLIPAGIIVLVWTNPVHRLIYSDITLLSGLPTITITQFQRAPLFWIANTLLIILHSAGTLRMIYNTLNARGKFRGQFMLLITAALLPSFAHVLLLAQIIPYKLDIVPIAFTLSGMLLFWGMFKIQLFDLFPIASNMVLNAIEDAVLVLDNKNRLTECNRSASSIFPACNGDSYGSPLEILEFRLWEKIRDIDDTAEISLPVNQVQHIFKASRSDIEHNFYGKLGVLYILHDITELHSHVRKLEKLASFDSLTGLFNRRHFMKLASMEVSRVNRYNSFFSLIIFDLDHFKSINDKYGHSAGDEALKIIGRLLDENTRAGDLYARYGGEEFVMLYRDTTPDQSQGPVERLRKAIEKTPVCHNKNTIHITASFDISSFIPGNGNTLEKSLQQADTAMYKAKKLGRNRICRYGR